MIELEALENLEQEEEPVAEEWGKDAKISFKPNLRIRVIRIIAVIYVFLNFLIGILFTSNSILVNAVVFLYLGPNTIILIHYLKLIRDKTK